MRFHFLGFLKNDGSFFGGGHHIKKVSQNDGNGPMRIRLQYMLAAVFFRTSCLPPPSLLVVVLPPLVRGGWVCAAWLARWWRMVTPRSSWQLAASARAMLDEGGSYHRNPTAATARPPARRAALQYTTTVGDGARLLYCRLSSYAPPAAPAARLPAYYVLY